MKLNPFHDNVLVERDKPEEKKSPGGIIMTEGAQKQPDTGVVIAVGPGRVMADGRTVKPDVKPGDRIAFGRFSGTEAVWEEESHLIVPWSDILGLVKEDG